MRQSPPPTSHAILLAYSKVVHQWSQGGAKEGAKARQRGSCRYLRHVTGGRREDVVQLALLLVVWGISGAKGWSQGVELAM